MHILVTNDDGPPSAQTSPYILPFVRALEAASHRVSVIIPSTQKSWISKAHLISAEAESTPYWPPSEVHSPADPSDKPPWILVDSTPATCAQLGLSHFFAARGEIDLVISGPNYGRNTTALFALSSGTLGAALEATVCGHKAIALSFAYTERENDAAVVGEACAHAVRVCEGLGARACFAEGALYSVNVPVRAGVSGGRVVWARILQNRWKRGGCFREVLLGAGEGEEDAEIRDPEGEGEVGATPAASRRRRFKWAPRFTDVSESVEEAGPGSDGWTVQRGETSVTALRANFMHIEGMEGEVKL